MSWRDWCFIALALLVLYNCNGAHATEVDFKYGLGLLDKKPSAEVKVFSFRIQDTFVGPFKYAVESGVWGDVGHGARRSSAFAQYQLGVRPESEHFYVQGFWGLAAISTPDNQLGGVFPQFAQDLGFGFKDKQTSIGLNYKHISSAGLCLPNKGRDFIEVVVGAEFP